MKQYSADGDLSTESGVGALYSNELDKLSEDLVDQDAAHDLGICHKRPGTDLTWRVLR